MRNVDYFYRQDSITQHTHGESVPGTSHSSSGSSFHLSGDTLTGGSESTGTAKLTPYQVLKLLPKDATPAQQDSAIQAWFQPGEIHYSQQPDTLHLPGHGIGRNLKEVNLPQYYRESFFSNDSLFHPELDAGSYGVAGDPLPYTIRNDSTITSLLLLCFAISLIAFSMCRNFMLQQLKSFFYTRKAEQMANETSTEIKFQFFYLAQTCLLMALLYFIHTQRTVADTFVLSDEYLLIGIFFLVFLGYFIFKYTANTIVNLAFFNDKRNIHYFQSLLFIHSLEGLFLFPAVMIGLFFDVDYHSIVIYCLITVILVKILTFYKCFIIFFRQNRVFLQIILYFCTLEIVPLFALLGGLEFITNALKINF